MGHGTTELGAADIQRLALVALVLGFADANDCSEPGTPNRLGLLAHQLVRFTMIGPPLGGADDNSASPGIGQHFSRDVPGVGAGWLRVAILRAQRECFRTAGFVRKSI